MTDRTGQHFGNYRLLRLLGRGGFAEVYLGQHIRIDKQAAIKLLHSHLSDEDSQRFQQEAQIIASLEHPHIVHILDFDVQQGVPFLVMDYHPDGSLRRRYPRGTRVPLSAVVSHVEQLASALHYAHEKKLVHRDVKPENMLVDQRGEIVLSDFGIATIAHSTSSMTNQPFGGTPPYMAPEQIQEHARPASDQYALAVVIYEWLCGELPFNGSPVEIFAKHLMVPPPPIRQKLPELPSEVEQVLQTALAKDSQKRFATVKAFATALKAASQMPASPLLQQMQEEKSTIAPSQPLQQTLPATPGTLLPTYLATPSSLPSLPPTLLELPPSQPQIGSGPATPPSPNRTTPEPLYGDDLSPSESQERVTPLPPTPTSRPRPLYDDDMYSSQDKPSQHDSDEERPAPPPLLWETPSAPSPSPTPTVPRLNTATVPARPARRKSALVWTLCLIAISVLIGAVAYPTYVHQQQIFAQNATATAFDEQSTATSIAQDAASATAVVQATADVVNANPYPSYMPGNATLALYDSLSTPGSWQEGSNTDWGGSCWYSSGYHVSQTTTQRIYYCTPQNTYSDFAFEVQMTVVQGDCGGMFFRTGNNGTAYVFLVCQDRTYDLYKYTDFSTASLLPTPSNDNSAIYAGLGQTNLLGVIAQGNTITLFINQQQIASVQDDSYSQGGIGLCASANTNSTEVVYNDAKVWTF
jgi:serine/threonine protein kinase